MKNDTRRKNVSNTCGKRLSRPLPACPGNCSLVRESITFRTCYGVMCWLFLEIRGGSTTQKNRLKLLF